MTDCPSGSALRRLIDGQQAGEALESHLAACPHCQEALDRLNPFSPVTTGATGAAPVPGAPVVPGYEILGPLGQGGMGAVFLARQTGLERPVALKVLRDPAAGPDLRERFTREARAMARLRHPHVAQIHEVGEAGGTPYFVLEYCPGGSLDAALRPGPLPARVAARLVEMLARAVQHAHEAGVVHRDLKPGNVLLADDLTNPRVTDFGLARRLGDVSQTQTGAILGTPSYMPPEQAEGQKDVGPLADVYALGAILYECLTGRPPFRGDTVLATLMQVRTAEVAPPRVVNPAVPCDLALIALVCLRKAPGRRYPSAAALADDLRAYLEGRPVSARPLPAWERAWHAARRRPALAAGLGVGAVLGAALVATGVGYTRSLEAALTEVRVQKGQAETEADRVRAHLHASASSLAWRDLDAGRLDQAFAWLPRAAPAHAPAHEEPGQPAPDRRGFEWHHLERFVARPVARLPRQAGQAYALAWSPDGQTLAVTGPGPVVTLWDPEPQHVRATLAGHTGRATGVAFAPDGTWLVTGGDDRTVRRWDARTGRALGIWKGCEQTVWSVAVSPDGRTVASGEGATLMASPADAVVRLWDVATGTVRAGPLAGAGRWLAYSPDGSALAGCGYRGHVAIFATASGELLARPVVDNLETNIVDAVAWSPDGGLVAWRSWERRIALWSPAGRRPVAFLPAPVNMPGSLAFSPDGAALAFGTRTGIDLHDVTGVRPALQASLQGEGSAGPTAFRPDGRRLAGACFLPGPDWGFTEVAIWDVPAARAVETLRDPGIDYHALAVAPDGALVAAAGKPDGQVQQVIRLWARHEGGWRRTSVWTGEHVQALAFAPDGAALVTAGTAGGRGVVRLRRADGTSLRLGHLAGPARGVAFTPDGAEVLAADAEYVRRWRVADGVEGASLSFPEVVGPVAVTSDGLRAVASGRFIHARNLEDGSSGFTTDPGAEVLDLAVAPDGREMAAVLAGGGVRVWALPGGEERHRIPSLGAVSLTFAPDGHTLAVRSAEDLILLDRLTGRERARLDARDLGRAAWSADGRLLAAAGPGRLVLRRAGRERPALAAPAAFRRALESPPGGVRAEASSTWPGWPAARLVDGQEGSSWCSAQGDTPESGRKTWVALRYGEPQVVRRVVVLGNRAGTCNARRVRIELLDGGGRVVAHGSPPAEGKLCDFAWAPAESGDGVRGVKSVRVVLLEGTRNGDDCIALGEVWVE